MTNDNNDENIKINVNRFKMSDFYIQNTENIIYNKNVLNPAKKQYYIKTIKPIHEALGANQKRENLSPITTDNLDNNNNFSFERNNIELNINNDNKNNIFNNNNNNKYYYYYYSILISFI